MTNKPDPLEVSPYVRAASERAQSYAQLGAMFAPKGPFNGPDPWLIEDCYMIQDFAPAPLPPAPRARLLTLLGWAVVGAILVVSLCLIAIAAVAMAAVALS